MKESFDSFSAYALRRRRTVRGKVSQNYSTELPHGSQKFTESDQFPWFICALIMVFGSVVKQIQHGVFWGSSGNYCSLEVG